MLTFIVGVIVGAILAVGVIAYWIFNMWDR